MGYRSLSQDGVQVFLVLPFCKSINHHVVVIFKKKKLFSKPFSNNIYFIWLSDSIFMLKCTTGWDKFDFDLGVFYFIDNNIYIYFFFLVFNIFYLTTPTNPK